jgi:hypothetical protein
MYSENHFTARLWWLRLVIPATQKTDQEDFSSRSALANSSQEPYLKKIQPKTGLVEWLKW